MSQQTKPTILITGASRPTLDRTYKQGDFIVRALINDGTFSVRALTRYPNDEHAREWAKLGVDIVQADMNVVDDCVRALQGCFGAYLITDFWEDLNIDVDLEIKHGKIFVDACKQVGLKHLVLFSTESCNQLTDGRMQLPMMDNKPAVADYARNLQVPLTELKFPFFMENFRDYLPPTQSESGVEYKLPLNPNTRVELISAQNIGSIILNVFKNSDRYLNKSISLASENPSVQEIASTFSRVIGRPVKFTQISSEEFRKRNLPAAAQWSKMFDLLNGMQDKIANQQQTRSLCSDLLTLEQWLQQNRFIETAERR